MFALIEGKVDRPFRDRRLGPTIASISAHVTVLLLLVVVPLLYFTDQLPEVPTMMAFVVPVDAVPPPPPPPPPPAAPKATSAPQTARTAQVPTASPTAAPVEAPREILPEPPSMPSDVMGVEGGVEGGIPGGVVGGVLGGIVAPPPPPPPPPPAPVRPSGPVRIGGQLKAPALIHRVDPVYPQIAVTAKITGVVVLEATVDETGRVSEVRVIQSKPFLDAAAVAAVKQWRYSPLILNDHATPFVLTVTLGFSFQ
jgi:protein TonB